MASRPSGRRPAHPPLVLALASVLLYTGCGRERDSLLQLDLVLPAALPVKSVRVELGGIERRYTWDVAQPRPSVGVDLSVPRAISGAVPVWVGALDDQQCVVAAQSTTVQLVPGEKEQAGPVVLESLPAPDCRSSSDGGADAAAAGDGGADGAIEPDALAGSAEAGQADQSVEPDAGADAEPTPPDAPADLGPPPPRSCAQAPCDGTDNCLGGVCQPVAGDCKALKSAGQGDGVYWVQVDGKAQRAYCDMNAEIVLCAARGQRQWGRTREGGNHKFSLWSELQPGEAVCKIWAVRHEDGNPVDRLFPAPGLTLTGCQALGFKGGDDGITKATCRYGADSAHGYGDCGYGKRPFYKWGNSCDCSLVNGQKPPRFVLEKGVSSFGIFESGLPWTVDGSGFGTCGVK